ncbi:MAG: substrate-binding domain-containing protein, partial [Anaerolineae bacterium]|nr:substrate-binding domain-containing protein [Anaerolineae bacterium]
PYVALDRIPEHYDGPSITIDNVLASRMGTEYLLSLGHTRVAHINGPLRLRLARERLKGYQDSMQERGLPVAFFGNESSNWRHQDGYEAMMRILAQPTLPTAIIAANDGMGIGAMRAIFDAGLRVPDDISLVGVDDLPTAAYCVPSLTTICQPFEEIGTLGIRMLLNLLEKKPIEQTSITLEPTLIVRNSTAPIER